MRVVTVANRKGGTGKTTTAFNLAYSLASFDKRVCLLDLDSQGNLTKTCKADFITRDDFLNAARVVVANNIDIICACNSFYELERELNENISPTTVLQRKILPHLSDYDFLIIDTSPAMNIVNTNGFIMSDIFLVVMMLDYYSALAIVNMLKIVNQLKEIRPDVECQIIVNQYRKNRNLNKSIEETLKDIEAFSHVFIPDRQIIRENIAHHKPSIDSIEEYNVFGRSLINFLGK